jgi:hypothetical protein
VFKVWLSRRPLALQGDCEFEEESVGIIRGILTEKGDKVLLQHYSVIYYISTRLS